MIAGCSQAFFVCLFVFAFVFFAFPLHLLSSPGTFSNLPPSPCCLYALPLGASRSASLPCFLPQSGLASAGQRSAVCTFSPAEEDLPTFMALSPPPSLPRSHPCPSLYLPAHPASRDPPARSWMCFDSRPVHNQTARQQLVFSVHLLPLAASPPLQTRRAHVGPSPSGGTRPLCGSRWGSSRLRAQPALIFLFIPSQASIYCATCYCAKRLALQVGCVSDPQHKGFESFCLM